MVGNGISVSCADAGAAREQWLFQPPKPSPSTAKGCVTRHSFLMTCLTRGSRLGSPYFIRRVATRCTEEVA
jgi:hypothetical protein